MNKNKGFTLVELLAVFVILAIIASIVMFSMNNIKSEYAKKVYTESVKNILTAAQNYYTSNVFNDFPTYGMSVNAFEIENKNQYTSGLIKYINDKLEAVHVSNGEYCANGTMDNLTVTEGDCGEYYLYYSNGTEIYFNPKTGKQCTDYIESNSNTNSNNVCMKWYAFNDSEEETNVSLILDHNTIDNITWSENSTYLNDTINEWQSNLKSHLITADEIAEITGNNSWNSSSTVLTPYYFDSHASLPSSTCQASNASDCKYGWLYDRTSTDCKTFGCLNNSNINTNGYWSLTRNANDYSSAWYVDYTGKIDTISTSYNSNGLRPVITISKSVLK